MRVSPAICNRVVHAVRGVLNQFVPDIFIYTDHCKGAQSGRYVLMVTFLRQDNTPRPSFLDGKQGIKP